MENNGTDKSVKPKMFAQRQKSNYIRHKTPLAIIDENNSSLNSQFLPPRQMQIQRYTAMTSRNSTRKPKGAVSRKLINLVDSENKHNNSIDSSKTGSRNLARQKSKVLRSFINPQGIKKTDVSLSSNYNPFEPSLDERLISPSHMDAARNSGDKFSRVNSSLQVYKRQSSKKRRTTATPSNTELEGTTQFSSPQRTKNWLENQKGYFAENEKMKRDMNNFCLDCQQPDPQWVSVNNGIFICINCAGQHRGYGVQISFVRSLQMDKIDDLHLKMLKFGGNRKFLEFIQLYKISDSDKDRHSKYVTKAVDLYRRLLSEMAINEVERPIDSDIFEDLDKQEGQKYIYDQEYVQLRSSNMSKSRKYNRESSLLQEAKSFGQFIKESIIQVGNLPQNFCCSASTVRKSELNKIVRPYPTRVSIDLIDDPYVQYKSSRKQL